jgi:hypothetical protein
VSRPLVSHVCVSPAQQARSVLGIAGRREALGLAICAAVLGSVSAPCEAANKRRSLVVS